MDFTTLFSPVWHTHSDYTNTNIITTIYMIFSVLYSLIFVIFTGFYWESTLSLRPCKSHDFIILIHSKWIQRCRTRAVTKLTPNHLVGIVRKYNLTVDVIGCAVLSVNPKYEGRSEINASYFIMLAHDVRGEYCWYGSRGWTFPPIFR